MRLGINMLSHPPQPSITVCACAHVCLQIGGEGCVRQRGEGTRRGLRNNLDALNITHKYTHKHTCICACTCTRARTDKHLGQSRCKVMSPNRCASYTSLVKQPPFFTPCETVDYACKFCCLQTDRFCCVSFYLLQLNVITLCAVVSRKKTNKQKHPGSA